MSTARTVLVIVLALIVLILVVQNAGIVTVRLLFWQFEASWVILIALTALAGFLCGYLVGRLRDGKPRDLPDRPPIP